MNCVNVDNGWRLRHFNLHRRWRDSPEGCAATTAALGQLRDSAPRTIIDPPSRRSWPSAITKQSIRRVYPESSKVVPIRNDRTSSICRGPTRNIMPLPPRTYRPENRPLLCPRLQRLLPLRRRHFQLHPSLHRQFQQLQPLRRPLPPLQPPTVPGAPVPFRLRLLSMITAM